MPTKKNHAVVITEEGATNIGAFAKRLIRHDLGVAYIYARKIDPSGPHYFHMTLEDTLPDSQQIEFELQIPHRYVNCVFYAADYSAFGFTADPSVLR